MMFLIVGSVLGVTGIIMGAYGAHGLKKQTDDKSQKSFENGVRYQQLHAVLLAAMGLIENGRILKQSGFWFDTAGWCFVAGVLLFSGSIYLAVWSGNRAFTRITPLGGIMLIAGWVCLGLVAF